MSLLIAPSIDDANFLWFPFIGDYLFTECGFGVLEHVLLPEVRGRFDSFKPLTILARSSIGFRTSPFHGEERGSIPRRATSFLFFITA